MLRRSKDKHLKRLKIYLAGPDVFLPDAIAIGTAKKKLCLDHGFEGLFPLDNEIDAPTERLDRAIYRLNTGLIAQADYGVFNLTPFRGVSADVGTVFELGMFIGLEKPVFAYSNMADDLITRFKASADAMLNDRTGVWSDRFGMSIEDFGNADNLMIDASLAAQGRTFHRYANTAEDRFRDMTGFVACLEDARAYRDITR